MTGNLGLQGPKGEPSDGDISVEDFETFQHLLKNLDAIGANENATMLHITINNLSILTVFFPRFCATN